MKHGARDNEIVRALFDSVVQDVKPANFETRELEAGNVGDVEIADDHVAGGGDTRGQPRRDGSVAATDFQTAPAGPQAEPLDVGALQGVEQLRHQGQPLPFAGEVVRQNISGHWLAPG